MSADSKTPAAKRPSLFDEIVVVETHDSPLLLRGSIPQSPPTISTQAPIVKKRKMTEELVDDVFERESIADSDAEQTKPNQIAGIMEKVVNAVKLIKRSTNKELHSKIQFNRADQMNVRDACDTIYGTSLDMMVKLNELLEENIRLQNALQEAIIYKSISSETPGRAKNRNGGREVEKKRTEPQKERSRTRYASIVRMENVQDPQAVRIEMAEHVNANEIGGALKGIFPLKDGGLKVESHTLQQKEKLNEVLAPTKSESHGHKK